MHERKWLQWLAEASIEVKVLTRSTEHVELAQETHHFKQPRSGMVAMDCPKSKVPIIMVVAVATEEEATEEEAAEEAALAAAVAGTMAVLAETGLAVYEEGAELSAAEGEERSHSPYHVPSDPAPPSPTLPKTPGLPHLEPLRTASPSSRRERPPYGPTPWDTIAQRTIRPPLTVSPILWTQTRASRLPSPVPPMPPLHPTVYPCSAAHAPQGVTTTIKDIMRSKDGDLSIPSLPAVSREYSQHCTGIWEIQRTRMLQGSFLCKMKLGGRMWWTILCLGDWDFCWLNLKMTPPVFISQPETEELVEWVLEEVAQGPHVAGTQGGPPILEVGCGSGAVSLSLLNKLPESQVIAVNKEEAAIRLTQNNAHRLQFQDRIQIIVLDRGSGHSFCPEDLDPVISKTPNIFHQDMKQLAPEILSTFVNLKEELKSKQRCCEKEQQLASQRNSPVTLPKHLKVKEHIEKESGILKASLREKGSGNSWGSGNSCGSSSSIDSSSEQLQTRSGCSASPYWFT
ncbi:PREDICTED: uncharacterized protein LOC106002679 [Dipodomys ordii]|uniref:Uncharacterized protein LOC106002679 n=1 Tax=Dipodomys ordii TaxID=10020 RepID=A0A1S3GW07_DIPOR|nr:PREDICTED: uncharacterized protein LOC106002679 [Dipodomys ordii]